MDQEWKEVEKKKKSKAKVPGTKRAANKPGMYYQ